MKTIRQRKLKTTVRYFIIAHNPVNGTPLPITTPGGAVMLFDTEDEAHEHAAGDVYCRRKAGYHVYPFPM